MKKALILFIFAILFLPLFLSKAYSYQNYNDKYQYEDFNKSAGLNTKISPTNSEVLFLIDYSGSMADPIQGRRKIDMSIEAIKNILRTTDNSTKIGLRIFGMTDKSAIRSIVKKSGYMEVEMNKENFCTASSLVLPISRYNAENVSNRVSKLTPRGSTPIEYALKQAVKNDFSPITKIKHIILVTDGEENCGGDPCLYIKKLMSKRDDYRINVIGITIDRTAYSQLNCIAEAGQGKYFAVNKPEDFNVKFKQAFDSYIDSNIKPDFGEPSLKDYKINYKTYVYELYK